MKRFLKEPLLHFFVLGAVIFLAYRIASDDTGPGPQSIVVTQGRVVSLTEGFTRVWQRPPTPDELEGLIRDHVREEVYYREALALGLDRDDVVVRRRLRQKLEFIPEDMAAHAEPTEEESRVFLDTHPEMFRVAPRFSFTQVYLNPEGRRGTLAADAAALLAGLRQAGVAVDAADKGDRLLLGHSFENLPAGDIGRLFGEGFASKLEELEPGQWQGPVESAYGAHLVLIRERTEGRTPELDEVRDAVRKEWRDARRQRAAEEYFQSLFRQYTVTIERPPSGEDPARDPVKAP